MYNISSLEIWTSGFSVHIKMGRGDLGIRYILLVLQHEKKLKIALYQSQREIHTVAARAAPGGLGLKSHPKDYQPKTTYHYGHPSKYKPRPMLLYPSVQGG